MVSGKLMFEFRKNCKHLPFLAYLDNQFWNAGKKVGTKVVLSNVFKQTKKGRPNASWTKSK